MSMLLAKAKQSMSRLTPSCSPTDLLVLELMLGTGNLLMLGFPIAILVQDGAKCGNTFYKLCAKKDYGNTKKSLESKNKSTTSWG